MIGRLRRALIAAALFPLAASGSCKDGSDAPDAQVPGKPPETPASPTVPAMPAGPRGAEFRIAGEAIQGGWLRGLAPQGALDLQLDGEPLPLDADGGFFAAFDRDAAASATLIARLPGDKLVFHRLAVARRAWRIEHVPIGPRPGATPSDEFLRRRAGELERINAARRIDGGGQGWRQSFIWPVKGRISGLFGSQRVYRGTPGGYHSGTDVATGASGTPFAAPADGTVILAAQSPFTLEGNLLMIDHGMGLNSAFLHCSQLLVREGERVRQGQIIGRIGMTGRANGPHLHWSLKWHGARLDPMLFAGPMR